MFGILAMRGGERPRQHQQTRGRCIIQSAISIAVVALTLTGCASMSGEPRMAPGAPYQLSAAERQDVESGVIAEMGAANAVFGGMAASRAEGADDIVVCGWVNPQNNRGEYAANQPFIGWLDGQRFSLMGTGVGIGTAQSYAVDIICGRYGIPLSVGP